MATIIFTIPDGQLQRVVDATKYLHKIPKINTGTTKEPVWENEFTDNQWAKEAWRRYIIAQIKRYETFNAKEAVNIPSDDSLMS